MHVERETKLQAPDGFDVPDLLAVKKVVGSSVRTLDLAATYWDTEDLALARDGVTLRRRTGEGPPTWTLKLPTADGEGRWELDVPSRAAQPPAALRGLLVARLTGPLQQVVTVRTRRTSRTLVARDGAALVEVTDDEVTAGEQAWRELEVEVGTSAKTAIRVVAALVEAGARVGDQTSKAQRALGVVEERPPSVEAGDPAALHVTAVLQRALRSLLVHDVGVRTAQDDAVHQLRVTCRRLRSDLRALRPLLDDPRVEPLREELAWAGRELSPARDLEVLRDRITQTAARPEPLDLTELHAVLADTRAVEAQVTTALTSPRYLALVTALRDLARDAGVSDLATRPCAEALPPLRSAAVEELRDQLRALDGDEPDEAWHEVRKTAKQARYVSEMVGTVVGGRKDVRWAKRLQTLLGEHTDAALTAEHLTELAAAHPQVALVCGRLVERERARAREVRRTVLTRVPG